MFGRFKKKFIGDKNFYRHVLIVALPIMIQNGFMNLMNLLDNLMVGRVGTDQMLGVAIVNQLLFIFNLSVFGALSGAGIFVAQYYGRGDKDGIKKVFRLKLLIATVIMLVGICILYFGRSILVIQFLHEGGTTGNLEEAFAYSQQYIVIMLIGIVPFAYAQSFASTLRETGETILPMKAAIASVMVNLGLNYILIYGKLGFPALGVRGAAIATVISRCIECLMIITWTWKQSERFSYMRGIFKEFRIPASLIKQVFLKGTPLLLNEFLWSAGVTMMTQCYSTRGLATVAGINICNTISNVFTIGMIALGSAVAIIVGQSLGSGDFEEAQDYARKLQFFSVVFCAGIGIVMAAVAPFFPYLYNTTDEARQLATMFILIMAVMQPFQAFTNASYFTLRSGGKTGITFLFDSGFQWSVCVVVAVILAYGTQMAVVPMYLICQSLEIIKCVIGFVLLKKGIWLHNLSEEI